MTYKDSNAYLIHAVAQRIDAESEQILLERFGIGLSQLKVLLCLEEKSGIPQKQIAKNLHQTEASISRQITVMYRKNLVVIKTGKDGRQNLVYPTSRGVEVIVKATKALQTLSSSFFDHLSPKQQKQFHECLQKVNKNMVD